MELGVVLRGKVLRFDPIRGYGFIAPESGGEDVFLHVNDLLDEKHLVRAGAIVEFRLEDGERGLKASEVRVAEAAPIAVSGPELARRAEDGRPDQGGEFCDVLSRADFRSEVTEILLQGEPSLSGAQILKVRRQLEELAMRYGWLDS